MERFEYTVHDKRSGEQLVGLHESVGIFEFTQTDKPQRLYFTMDEMIRLLRRIERTTGRKVGCQELTTKW